MKKLFFILFVLLMVTAANAAHAAFTTPAVAKEVEGVNTCNDPECNKAISNHNDSTPFVKDDEAAQKYLQQVFGKDPVKSTPATANQ